MAEAAYKQDQLHDFFKQNKRKFDEMSSEKGGEGIELSLGLSLNGRFGSDPTRPDMHRSSSFTNFVFSEGGAAVEAAALVRTRSLPAEAAEEWRRRKEEQTMRRMEAKRKRVGKMTMSEKGRMGGRPIRERHLSVASQGSSSSGVSESEAQPICQANPSAEAITSLSPQSLPKQNKSNQTVPIGETKMNKPPTNSIKNYAKETMKTMMVDMPCVSTRGLGPKGKRIEGFLYQYQKGEEVRIVCVCHGSFLSPAEFVEHAGGGGVSQPLKHIVVNPSALS